MKASFSVVACLFLVVVTGRVARVPQAQVFHGQAEGVRIDVMVTNNGQPVPGLTKDDFVVVDEGVAQQIDAAVVSSHVSIALVIDTSASITGSKQASLFRARDAAVSALRPGDTASLLTFSDRLRVEVKPSHEFDGLRKAPLTIFAASKTSMWDAVMSSVALVDEASGRPLILLLSDGMDNTSWLSQSVVTDRLKRLGWTLDVVRLPLWPGCDCDISYGKLPWEELEKTTLGASFDVANADLSGQLAHRLADLRASYVLTFTPTGVKHGDGWHKLTVRAKNGKWKVQARAGYFAGT